MDEPRCNPEHACPCCAQVTLHERGAFEICPVCFWEDDGQDDVDAHMERGGPNQGTLWQARANYLRFSASTLSAKAQVRPPHVHETGKRRWQLVDGVAVERLLGDDSRPWNLLHDGFITGLEREGERVSVWIQAAHLRARFPDPGTAFRLELLDCTRLAFAPYDALPTDDLPTIADEEPDLVQAAVDGTGIVVWASSGSLRLSYASLGLRLDSGAPIALAALARASGTYWDE